MILCVRFRYAAEPDGGSGEGSRGGSGSEAGAGSGIEAALPVLLGLAEDISPVVQALPPDAALVDVRGAERYFGQDARGLAAVLRVRALAHAGADCTIGVAATPMLSRMAARRAEPGTTLVIADGEREVRRFLAPMPVAALPGIGTATARALRAYGIDTVGKTAGVPLSTLQRIAGVRMGRELYEKAQGIDRTAVVPNAAARSLGAERTFSRDELDRDRQRRALLSITEELGVRMRGTEQVCRSLTLTVRYADRSTTTRTRVLREPTAHSAALSSAVYRIHESLGLQRARVRALSVRAEDLIPAERATRQLTLDPVDDRARRIEAVADLARAKFGPQVLMPGSLAA
ncbi:DNA polymerase thumb domain-containing protein [Streptomyces sp. NPDC088725]|uniref:DNA polymerase Y family protein n=1 Tax=Streptomyces sp. NPDC088725 TaxID=3365873 RepID=UPI0037FD0D2B